VDPLRGVSSGERIPFTAPSNTSSLLFFKPANCASAFEVACFRFPGNDVMRRFGAESAGILAIIVILGFSSVSAQSWVQNCPPRGNLGCPSHSNRFQFSFASEVFLSSRLYRITHNNPHQIGSTCGTGNCLPTQPYFNCTLVRPSPFFSRCPVSVCSASRSPA
jgi:hypothetical protein